MAMYIGGMEAGRGVLDAHRTEDDRYVRAKHVLRLVSTRGLSFRTQWLGTEGKPVPPGADLGRGFFSSL